MKDLFIDRIIFQLIFIGIASTALSRGYGCPEYNGYWNTGDTKEPSYIIGVLFPLVNFIPIENQQPKCK